MDIYEEIVSLRKQGRTCALASITNTVGSIPSSDTAKMLVRDDGSIVGTIGGGAGELEVIQIAREVIKLGKPQTISFNLTKRPGIDAGMVSAAAWIFSWSLSCQTRPCISLAPVTPASPPTALPAPPGLMW